MSVQQRDAILLVDDQPQKILTYHAILESLGETLISAGSAQEALAVLVKSEVAVILMDVCLPDIDGFELAAMIRQHPRHEKTAIIFVSGVRLSQDDLVKGYKIGAVDYVPVPVEPEILKAKVRVFVDLHRKTKLLRGINEELETRVAERTHQLETTNEMLARSEERLRLAAEAAQFASYEFDVDEQRFQWSQNARDLLRIPSGGLGTLEEVLRIVQPSDRRKLLHRFTRFYDDERPIEMEFRVAENAAQGLWLSDRSKVVTSSSGKPQRIVGTFLDISMRKEAEEHQTLLMGELDHRVKNVLANVLAIARLSSAGATSVAPYVSALQGRLQSMSAAHDLLRQCDWRGADLHRLVSVTLEPFSANAKNIAIEGDAVMLPARTAQSLALVLHELTTNAVKHGALSSAQGRVSISWRSSDTAGDVPRFWLSWKENGGPRVVEPKQRGFGLTVLKSAASELGGSANLTFEDDGILFEFERSLTPASDAPFRISQLPRPEMEQDATISRRVLVVEDELLVGLQLSQDLEDQGYCVIGPACTIEQGIELVQEGGIDCALIDVRLGDATSSPIASLLRERDIPFALTTGFDEQHPMDNVFEGAPRLNKPYNASSIGLLLQNLR
jgi:PAS domain S-box-containing protein